VDDDWSIQMSEPLVKQIVDLKEEHSLMLEALKMVLEELDSIGLPSDEPYDTTYKFVKSTIKAAEEGNKRRLERGNVELP
jgi:hypothetical protein